RQIEVAALDDRIARQDRIAVLAATADVDVGKPCVIAQAQLLGEQLDLVVVVGARDAAVDLLQHRDIDVELLDHLGDAQRIVAPIDATDALVDVVAQCTEPHGAASRAASCATTRVSSSASDRPERCAAMPRSTRSCTIDGVKRWRSSFLSRCCSLRSPNAVPAGSLASTTPSVYQTTRSPAWSARRWTLA